MYKGPVMGRGHGVGERGRRRGSQGGPKGGLDCDEGQSSQEWEPQRWGRALMSCLRYDAGHMTGDSWVAHLLLAGI